VLAAYSCRDNSGTPWCVGTAGFGRAIDTRPPGTKTFAVTARDRAGNTSTRLVRYVVNRKPRPKHRRHRHRKHQHHR